jgi:hypothetical protein
MFYVWKYSLFVRNCFLYFFSLKIQTLKILKLDANIPWIETKNSHTLPWGVWPLKNEDF